MRPSESCAQKWIGLVMQAVSAGGTSVKFYETNRRNNPEAVNFKIAAVRS
jgi:hypothetical protein